MFSPLALRIATRYLRSKRRNRFGSFITIASVFGIALGVAVLTIVLSVMNGFEVEVSRHVLGMTAHTTVYQLGEPLDNWESVGATVRAQRHVIAAAPFARASGMLSHRNAVRSVMVYGIDPRYETQVSDISNYLGSASISSLSAASNDIFLGQALARDLGVRVGDPVTLALPNWDRDNGLRLPIYARFRVAGTFHSGMHEFDANLALTSLTRAQALLQLGTKASGLRVKLDDPQLAPVVSAQIAEQLGTPYGLVNWTQYHRNFFYALKSQKRIMFVILSLIIAIAAFNIVASMIMLIKEKRRDIAILRTFGYTPRAVLAIFLTQGVIIGAIGAALGIILGYIGVLEAPSIVAVIEQWFDIKFIKPDVYYIDYLPAEIRIADVALVALAAFCLCVLATFYPAWSASRIQPAEALRYE